MLILCLKHSIHIHSDAYQCFLSCMLERIFDAIMRQLDLSEKAFLAFSCERDEI